MALWRMRPGPRGRPGPWGKLKAGKGFRGGLGGFSAPQGVVLKQRLLAMEGALTGLGGRSVGPNGAKARQLPLQRGLAIFA